MLYKRYILHIIIDNNDIKTDIAVANNKAQLFCCYRNGSSLQTARHLTGSATSMYLKDGD